MKSCLLILSIYLFFVPNTFSQKSTRESTLSNSAVYFQFNSITSAIIASRPLINADVSINESNLEMLIKYLNSFILNDSLESQIKVGYIVTRDEYLNMSSSKKLELDNFIESLHLYIDALEPIKYPKKAGYFLPDHEIENLTNILELK
ncbi:MAG: hypothetical protein RI922_179 [Bacteroidota bacterium]|jgi:hypothetical protein